ncbi:MAG: hypothetical protein AAF216_10595 [Pseudomonadota bacterium]
MAEKKPPVSKEDRLAKALRDNLRRRKTAQRKSEPKPAAKSRPTQD